VVDVYFSADVETDGPIPGPYSMLSFALVEVARFDGQRFERVRGDERSFYAELKPISDEFQAEALAVNGLDRERLRSAGRDPVEAMTEAASWVAAVAGGATPVLVAYPLAFDWSWLYWYFVRFSKSGSPFNHSRCFDVKTAFAVKAHRQVVTSGRDELPPELLGPRRHTHNALDDAREQADIFAKLFEWDGG
jgi:DNA polymerase III epsilon subunit-like protein